MGNFCTNCGKPISDEQGCSCGLEENSNESFIKPQVIVNTNGKQADLNKIILRIIAGLFFAILLFCFFTPYFQYPPSTGMSYSYTDILFDKRFNYVGDFRLIGNFSLVIITITSVIMIVSGRKPQNNKVLRNWSILSVATALITLLAHIRFYLAVSKPLQALFGLKKQVLLSGFI